MPVDPQIQMLLNLRAALPQLHTLSVADARAQFAARDFPGLRTPGLAGVVNRDMQGPAGSLALRIYTPLGDGPFPLMVFFHGSGFVVCSLDTHDGMCRNLCAGTGCVVVSVDYRLAPEAKFPAAPDDCLAATRWAAANAAALGADPGRMLVAGDSAGATSPRSPPCASATRAARSLLGQLLIYPVTDYYDPGTPSMTENAEGYGLTRAGMIWFWDHYLADPADGAHPHASPLRADDLSGLPPALVVTAEYDPLRDEGERYADRLQQAGVPTAMKRWDGMNHGFFFWPGRGGPRRRGDGRSLRLGQVATAITRRSRPDERAAVHIQDRARQVARRRGAQERDRPGQFLRPPDPPHWQGRPQVEPARHRRLHRSGRHRVDQHPTPHRITRQPFHQCMHRALRGSVVRRRGQRGAAGLARHRSHQRDVAAAMPRHVVDRRRGELQRHPHVDVHHPVEPLVPGAVLGPRPPLQDAGAMRHGMHALAGKQRGDERIVGQVALHRRCNCRRRPGSRRASPSIGARSEITSSAPSCASTSAVALPIPLAAPVTSAALALHRQRGRQRYGRHGRFPPIAVAADDPAWMNFCPWRAIAAVPIDLTQPGP